MTSLPPKACYKSNQFVRESYEAKKTVKFVCDKNSNITSIFKRSTKHMIIFPAIDILDGQCVLLIQGDYNQEKIYSDAPAEMAKQGEAKGASYIHIVDLNGAKTGESVNKDVINHIAQSLSIPVQVGGGIRSLEAMQGYLENGVSRVIIGTAAITDREFLKEAIRQ